ncbi:MAG: putative acyltransferase [Bradyrhizobium sp.]|nr:putative acyltransferase [Bradyrhizobium sp.]
MHGSPPPVTVQTDYRPDIDGLRAVAVVAVLLFHLGFAKFSGGFVGVDVFFVISGFLITGIIKRGIEQDRFSLIGFYAGRGRRLLPGLFVVIAVSNVAAFLLLSPEHLQSFARSAVGSVFGFSNILFWQETGYFDLSARMKPLLHTWTLSLEWQFYLVWPAFIAFALSGRWRWSAPQTIAAAGGASLLLAAILGIFWPAATFYNMPFRIFEFAIGALLIWAPAMKRGPVVELLPIAGLALIAFAVFQLNGKDLHNPALMLLPAVGAALVILGSQLSFFGLLVRNPVAEYIGKISYSVYLVHWPLIVFTEYYFFRGLTTSEAWKLFAVSILLGAALHHLIERPIHKRKIFNLPGYASATTMGLAALVITLPALLAGPDGLSWRVDTNALGLRYDNTKSLVSKEILGHLGCTEPCVFGKDDGPLILVFGDSHVDHFTKMLLSVGGTRYRFHYAGSAGCFNGATLTSKSPHPSILAGCQKARETLLGWLKTYQYKAVIVGQRWLAYGQELYKGDERLSIPDQATVEHTMLADVEALLPGFTGPVIVAGWAPITNTACYARPHYLPMTCPTIPLADYDTFRKVMSEFKAKTTLKVHFVDVAQAICPNGKCATTDRDGHILYTDSDHLSIYGALLIVPQFLSIIDAKPR